MNELIQPSAPLWASILLVTLIAIIVVSIFSFFVAALNRNTKLGQISMYTATASMISFFGLLIAIVFISWHVMTNSNTYTITKTDTSILVNSKSDWIANSTYNIVNHKDGTYYLEDTSRPRNLIKLSDDELGKMIAKE